jgi:hypothetical protein
VSANVASSVSDYSSLYDEDEEAAAGAIEEDDYEDEDALVTPRARGAADDEELSWDEADLSRRPSFRHDGPGELLPATGSVQPILLPPAHESTALLHKAVSFSYDTHPDREHLSAPQARPRRVSTSSQKSAARYEYTGKSTFGQTVRSP